MCYNAVYENTSGEKVMEEKKTPFLYKIIRRLVLLFYPRTAVSGTENLPEEEPCVVVGNHTQMNGPIAGELYFPGPHYIWCAGQMMELKEVPGYAYQDFWSGKPKYIRWYYKLASYLIAPLAVLIFNSAHTIPVYHDARILTTFRQTVRRLQEGARVVIFPEYDKKYNNILYDFQERFVDVARIYYKKTGQALSFVPMYIAPALRTMYLGKPVRFDPAAPMAEERARICAYLKDEITRIAAALPEHTVVPYRNVPRRQYPKNTPIEVYDHEQNCR